MLDVLPWEPLTSFTAQCLHIVCTMFAYVCTAFAYFLHFRIIVAQCLHMFAQLLHIVKVASCGHCIKIEPTLEVLLYSRKRNSQLHCFEPHDMDMVKTSPFASNQSTECSEYSRSAPKRFRMCASREVTWSSLVSRECLELACP